MIYYQSPKFRIIKFMDNKKFQEELSKIAHWYIPILSDGTTKFRKPLPKSNPNPTLGPIIDQLIPQLRVCSSCDLISDQRISHTLKFRSIDGKRNMRRWEHTCQSCRLALDPKTMRVRKKIIVDLVSQQTDNQHKE